MTRLMEQAIEQLRAIPDEQQDQLAQFVLNELKEDERWSGSTSDHEEKLKNFISTVLAADNNGNCELLDPDRL